MAGGAELGGRCAHHGVISHTKQGKCDGNPDSNKNRRNHVFAHDLPPAVFLMKRDALAYSDLFAGVKLFVHLFDEEDCPEV